jgi:hypothetical protein
LALLGVEDVHRIFTNLNDKAKPRRTKMSFWDNVGKVLEVALESKLQYERGQRMANLALGDTGVTGSLAGANDFAVYAINLYSRGAYLFQLTQPTLWADFDLYVLDDEGRVVAADTSANNPSQVQVTGSGPCYVAVKSARGGGAYSLMARRM